MSNPILKNVPYLRVCDDTFFDTLNAGAQQKSYKKGQILFLHEDEATRFYFIVSGWVKLFRETQDGVQSVVNILNAGNIFGETSIFENDLYPYSAEVVEPAEIISYSLNDLKKEIEKNNKLALSMLSAMAKYRREQDAEIEHRSIQNASQRIGCFLLRLVEQDAEGPIKIELPYDKILVASRLGMQPETFSRALAKLRDKTGIRVQGSTIEVDNLDQLNSFSCEACSSEFPCKDLNYAKK